MVTDINSARKRSARLRIRTVEEILRRWDPIGVEPGTLAPSDEYDSYAPAIVSLVARGCSLNDLVAYLHSVRTETIGVGEDHESDRKFASEIISMLRGH